MDNPPVNNHNINDDDKAYNKKSKVPKITGGLSPTRYRVTQFFQHKWSMLQLMIDVLGKKLFFFIITTEHLLKGFLAGAGSAGVFGLPILFLFRSYQNDPTGSYTKLDAIQIQIFKTVALTPWALKSFIGIVVDNFYIGGYNKIPYMFVSTMVSVYACVILALTWPLDPVIVTCLLFLIFFNVSISDLLTEAKYSEKINKNSEFGPSIVSYVWNGIFFCQIFSTLLVGYLLEIVQPHWIYLIPVLPL